MSGKDGCLSEGIKQMLAKDHLVQHAQEMANKQMDRELLQIPKPAQDDNDPDQQAREKGGPEYKAYI
jgi:hypothetical protein